MVENYIQAGVGILLALVIVAGLLFVYYSRANTVEKTGYGSLVMLLVVCLMIPVFWFMEGQKQTHAQEHLYEVGVQRGAMLYGQFCTYQCFAIDDSDTDKGPQVVNMTYNGYSLEDIQKMTDFELDRVISAGIFKAVDPASPPPANANFIPRIEEYGGQLLSNDVDYLRTFLRSTDEAYVKSKHFDKVEVDPREELVEYLRANSQAQYDAAVSYFRNGRFGDPKDLTAQKTFSMDIVDIDANKVCPSTVSCYTEQNIKVKVGTKITWDNKSTLEHSVTAVEGTNIASPQAAADIFDSGLFGSGEVFELTITEEIYNAAQPIEGDPDARRIAYYCTIHPDMLAQLVIVK